MYQKGDANLMAQLKDLVVSGAARILGRVYATLFVGDLQGNADSATNDSENQPIASTYVKGFTVVDNTHIKLVYGNGTESDSIELVGTTYSTGNGSTSGITKLYSTLGNNEDGALTQKAVNDHIITSPAFTGTPTSTTPATSDNSTRIATTAFVRSVCQELIEELVINGTYTTQAMIVDENGVATELVTADTAEPIDLTVSVES